MDCSAGDKVKYGNEKVNVVPNVELFYGQFATKIRFVPSVQMYKCVKHDFKEKYPKLLQEKMESWNKDFG